MPAVIQNSFAAGEISPRMLSRTDLKGYKEGCQELTNMICTSHGPVLSRPGTYHVKKITPTTRGCRLVPFHVAPDEVYMLVFAGTEVHVLQESGLPVAASLVANGRFQQGSVGWTSVVGSAPGPKGTVSFVSGTCVLDGAANNPAGIWQMVTTVAGAEYRVAVSAVNRNNARIKIGTTTTGGQLATLDMGTTLVDQITFTATSTSTYIYVEQPAGRVGSCILSSIGMIPTASSMQTNTVLVNPFPAGALREIQYEMQPAGKALYLSHPQVIPQRVVFTAPSSFAIEAVPFTGAPDDWGANDYPAGITFFQGRLWFAGSLSHPSKVWASKSGLFTDFTVGADADDGLNYTIAKAGNIRWIKGMKDLLLGSDNSEFVLSSEGGVITPSDITIEPQSAYGSLAAAPLQVGNQSLYISADGRKVRAMGYRFEESGWVSTDLTFASEHITRAGLYQMAWAQNPENIIWAIDAGSQLIGCTYDKANTIIGWHKHRFPGYDPIAVAAARFLGTDRVWLALYDPEVQDISVCIMTSLTTPDIFVDNATRRDYETPTSTITGLEYLEGKTVQVVVNGAVHPERTVTGGQITLQIPATVVVVGTGYTRTVTPMPVEYSDNQGATETRKKRFSKIYVRLNSSERPMINGVRPATRFPATPMDAADLPRDEDVQVLNFGWNRREQITVTETLPVNLSIISLFAELATS